MKRYLIIMNAKAINDFQYLKPAINYFQSKSKSITPDDDLTLWDSKHSYPLMDFHTNY